MLSNGQREYHRRPRNSKHRGEYSVGLVTLGLVLVIVFIIYRIHISYSGKLQNGQEIEFVSYYEPKESFNVRSQATYYEQFLTSLVEQPNCPLFKNGRTLKHTNHVLNAGTLATYHFVEDFVVSDKTTPMYTNSSVKGALRDYYKLVDGIDEQPIAIIAPWTFAYETNNVENAHVVSISSTDPLGTGRIKVKLEFENAYWPCVGGSPTMDDLTAHITHYDRMGNGNLSIINSGSAGDIVAYATKDTVIHFYLWDEDNNVWSPCTFQKAILYN